MGTKGSGLERRKQHSEWVGGQVCPHPLFESFFFPATGF